MGRVYLFVGTYTSLLGTSIRYCSFTAKNAFYRLKLSCYLCIWLKILNCRHLSPRRFMKLTTKHHGALRMMAQGFCQLLRLCSRWARWIFLYFIVVYSLNSLFLFIVLAIFTKFSWSIPKVLEDFADMSLGYKYCFHNSFSGLPASTYTLIIVQDFLFSLFAWWQ